VTSISYDGGPDETEVIFNVTGNESLQTIGIISTIAYVTTSRNPVLRDRLRVEKWEHFYGDNELIDLGVVQEYSEEPFDNILYNEIAIKFSKFANDEDAATTLEEIHTDSGWTLPVAKSDKKLSLNLSWIGSTFLFNQARESIFSKKPTTSNVLDDSIFFCDKAEKTGVYTVNFSAGTDKITMPADAYENVVNGSNFFSISDAVDVANNITNEIDTTQQVIFDITNDEYDVPVLSTLSAESGDEVTITHVADTRKLFKPESNDKLTSSSGITRPAYFMNQRRTMKRFLIRWGRYISSVLAYIVDANVTIQNLFYINNGAFASELDTSQLTSDCLMGDSTGGSIIEADNINTDALGAAKFKPNFIHGTVKICDEDFDLIKNAHKNVAPNFAILDGTKFGTSTIAKADTNFIHQTGIFDITLVARFDNYADTVEFNYLAATYVTGNDGFAITYSNSLAGFVGFLTITIRVGGSTSFAYTQNISSILNDSKKHTIRYIGKGATVEILVDGVVMAMTADSISPGGSADSNQKLEIGGVSGTPTDMHEGLYESFILKNGSNEEIINYQFNERQGLSIANEGADAPASSGLTFNLLPIYQNNNYGYLTVTSPNAKTVAGWLMEAKRNPVDRIAKIKLLEKA